MTDETTKTDKPAAPIPAEQKPPDPKETPPSPPPEKKDYDEKQNGKAEVEHKDFRGAPIREEHAKCPNCTSVRSRVINTKRPSAVVITRRRECRHCGCRYPTIQQLGPVDAFSEIDDGPQAEKTA